MGVERVDSAQDGPVEDMVDDICTISWCARDGKRDTRLVFYLGSPCMLETTTDVVP